MADATERLLLQVDAATELLRRHLAEGEQPLERFERRADQMAERVDRSISQMGSRFGAFAQLADDAAKRTQQSFEASFSQVQRIAAQAIKGPTVDGRVNLGADDIRAGAAAAQEQARAFELIGEAAQRTATRVNDTSEATRLFIQATNASRIEAQQKANALTAEAAALERIEIELLQSAEAADLFVGKHQRLADAAAQERQLAVAASQAATEQRALAAAAAILRAELDPMYAAQQRFDAELDRAEKLFAAGTISAREYAAAQELARQTLANHAQAVAGSSAVTGTLVAQQQRAISSTGAHRAAMQGLSFQAQDTFTQISMGANVLSVIAIQGGQAAGQFAMLEGRVGAVARVLIGPWGLAATAALLVIGAITSKMSLFNDEVAEAVEKLQQDAREADTAGQAKARFGRTVEGVSLALDEQNKTLEASIRTQREVAQATLDAAAASQAAEQAARRRTVAELQQAQALRQKARAAPTMVGGGGEFGGMAAGFAQAAADRDDAALAAQLKIAEANVAKAERGVRVAYIPLARMNAAAAASPTGAVDRRFEDRQAKIEAQFKKDGNRVAYDKALTAAAIEHQREVKDVRESRRKKRGPSAETLERRAEAARQKVLSDDISFSNDERAARRRLIDAKQRSADTEDEREKLARDEINADIDGLNKRVRLQQSKGERSKAEADSLVALNESTRAERLKNVATERAMRMIEAQYDATEGDLQARLAILKLGEDLTLTEAQRREVSRQILEIEQELRRKALERLRDTSNDPRQVQRAKDDLARLPAVEEAEQRQNAAKNAGPIDQYRERLRRAVGDINTSVQGVAVNGFLDIENSLSRIIDGTESVGSAFKNMARSIIADLARIAVQALILKALDVVIPGAGSFLGAVKKADGGFVRGPGGPRDDAVPAFLSNGEFVISAGPTARFRPLLEAINDNHLPRFADGGLVGSAPNVPRLAYPQLPAVAAGGGGASGLVNVRVSLSDDLHATIDNRAAGVAVQVVRGAAPNLVEAARAATAASLVQPKL